MVGPRLDAEQFRVVSADPEARLLVLAGAGRGKTEVVAGRIDFLSSQHGLYDVDEIIVLSFSRAAVRAVQKRTMSAGTAAAGISTFDSFASRVLVEAGKDPLDYRGFDARIRAATQLLRAEGSSYPGMFRHVILDEVQDLVGYRADFAMALLDAVHDDCGFTALGDPLQAIYDWQIVDARSATTTETLLRYLQDDRKAEVIELATNYRARGREPIAVAELGEILRSVSSGSEARSLTEQFRDSLIDLGSLRENADLVSVPMAQTAVLCRSNGDALKVAQYLRAGGVPHVVRRRLEDTGAVRWIAEILGRAEANVLSRRAVEELLVGGSGELEVDEAWVALKTAEGDSRSPDSLKLEGVRRAVRNGSLPIELRSRDDAGVVVSTVHRAKGLEFDRVLLVDSFHRADVEDWGESRVLYVALSRARDELLTCSVGGGRIAKHAQSGRWTARTWRNFAASYAMETLPEDVETSRPAVDDSGDGRSVQSRLHNGATVGSSIRGILDPASTVEEPRYVLSLGDGWKVGRTSERFAIDMVRIFGRRKSGASWPLVVEDMVIGAVETAAGPPDATREAGIGSSGLWLVPRLAGLARPVWETTERTSA